MTKSLVSALVVLVALVVSSACSESSSPTGPTGPTGPTFSLSSLTPEERELAGLLNLVVGNRVPKWAGELKIWAEPKLAVYLPEALRIWEEKAIPVLRLSITTDENSANVHVRVGDPGNGYCQGGAPLDYGPVYTKGKVAFCDSSLPQNPTEVQILNVARTMAHELGHVIGIGVGPTISLDAMHTPSNLLPCLMGVGGVRGTELAAPLLSLLRKLYSSAVEAGALVVL